MSIKLANPKAFEQLREVAAELSAKLFRLSANPVTLFVHWQEHCRDVAAIDYQLLWLRRGKFTVLAEAQRRRSDRRARRRLDWHQQIHLFNPVATAFTRYHELYHWRLFQRDHPTLYRHWAALDNRIKRVRTAEHVSQVLGYES